MSLMTVRYLFGLFLFSIFMSAQAEELTSANRWDMSLSPYKFQLQGELVRAIKDYRTAVNQTGIAPARDRQIRAETTRLKQLLDSRGYYQASIASAYDEDRMKPVYEIQLGRRYAISSIQVVGDYLPEDNAWQTLEIGDALNAVDVIAQQGRLRSYIGERNCYFQYSVEHQVELNDANRTGQLTLVTRVATPAQFGRVTFIGAGDVNIEFLNRVAGLRSGQCYKRAEIDSAVISLFDTGLFSQVRPAVSLQENSSVDVAFALVKREERTLSASIGFETEIGPIIGLGWQHRDLFSSAQSLTLGLQLQPKLQTVTAGVVIPSFYDRRNRLNWLNKVEHGNDDIEYYSFSSTATLERQASRQNYYEYGIGVNQINERTDDDWRIYRQIRVPLKYQFDSVQDPFNPLGGYRYSIDVEPVFDVDEDFTPFMLSGLGVQNFIAVDPQFTIASRLRLDSLWYGGLLGSTLNNIPETEWFTAGGSTSIRGYAYQSISVGGNGSRGATQRWLVTNEARLRLSETWGLVGFLDAGSVGAEINPLTQDEWFTGAGAGIRFFTRFAPLRVDVAFPLNPRQDDSAFLIYVSLGQAF